VNASDIDYSSEITNGDPDYVYDRIDDEDRCIREVGYAIYKGHFFDQEFRSALAPLIYWLSQRCFENKLTRHLHYQDSFNSFVVSAFHSARSAELLMKTAEDYVSNLKVYSHLVTAHHSFGNQLILDIIQAQGLLINETIVSSFNGIRSEVILGVFKSLFPRLKDARDSIAHADDRSLGIFKFGPQPIADSGSPRQSIGQFGSKIFGLLGKDQQEFAIDCSSIKIFSLITELKLLFKIG
jgi:hypothetical protein